MPRKTESNSPADWLYLSEHDLAGIRELADRELSYEMCRSKLAEVIEKLMKAELLRRGWFLEKTRDLEKLAGELEARHSEFGSTFHPLVTTYAEAYFMSRYPGFDLEDPDWPALRQDVAAVQSILENIKARLTPPADEGT